MSRFRFSDWIVPPVVVPVFLGLLILVVAVVAGERAGAVPLSGWHQAEVRDGGRIAEPEPPGGPPQEIPPSYYSISGHPY